MRLGVLAPARLEVEGAQLRRRAGHVLAAEGAHLVRARARARVGARA